MLMNGVGVFGGLMLVAIGVTRFNTASIFEIIVGLVFVFFSCREIVKYLRIPSEIITVDNKGFLHLPKDVTLDPKDIVDVSYRRARGRSATYDWGEVIIITHIESFRLDYVDDCENVSKELTRMMYESKKGK